MPKYTGMKTCFVMLGSWFCLGAGLLWAGGEGEKTPEKTKPDIFVGAGALFVTEPYRGMSARVYPVPLFGYESERLYLRGVSGGYRLFQGEGWSVGPVVQPRFEGYKSSDSSALIGMEDRRITVDAGVGFSWQTRWGLLSVSWVADILGRHGGYETELAYTVLFPWKGFDIIPSLGIRCKSSSLTNYYYGVDSEEALPGRPSYKAGPAIDPFARIAVKRDLVEKFSLLGAVQCEWFDAEIKDSPIVDRTHSISFLTGLLYTF
jgi:MipA family protein